MGLFSSIGSIFGGVGSAVGGVVDGVLGMKSDKDKSEAQQQAEQQAAQLNYEQQKEFAQNGIRWRVEDAKEAGLHPLAALGAQSPSFTPTFSSDAFYREPTSSILNNGLHSMGQNISRAKAAKMQEQDRFLENSWKAAQIERLQADTALLQAQAAKMTVDAQQLPPSFPDLGVNNRGQVVDGQPDSGLSAVNKLIQLNPSQAEANVPEKPNVAAATNPDMSFLRTGRGGSSPVRSDAAATRLEDDWIASIMWHLRNSVGAILQDQRVAPPKSDLPKGYNYWRFDPEDWSWFPSKTKPQLFDSLRNMKWF